METIEIRRGTRFYPPGLNDFGDKAPEVLYVRGNHEALARQAVVVAGSADATPRGRATARRLSHEISRTDIAVVSDFSSLERMSWDAASLQGVVIVYFTQPLDELTFDLPFANVLGRGGTVVSLQPDHSASPADYEDLAQVMAAHSTVTLVPEANIRADSLFVANHAASLGRKVAVVNPPGPGIQAFDGTYELATRATTVLIGENDGHEIIKMVGVAPRTENDDLMRQLDHLEFSSRVAQLRQRDRLDSATERKLFDMAHESTNMREFQSRMHYGGARLVGATEHRYLMTTLETREGQRPQDWKECEAWVRAFGFDRYENVCNVPQTQLIEQHQPTLTAQR